MNVFNVFIARMGAIIAITVTNNIENSILAPNAPKTNIFDGLLIVFYLLRL